MLPDIILLDGPVGSGKGTQAYLLNQKFGYNQFGFSNELRDFVDTYSQDSNHPNYSKAVEIQEIMQKGDNVSPEDLFFTAGNKIEKLIAENKKIVIDSAKNIEAFQWLADTARKHGLNGLFIRLNLSIDISIERLSHRYYAPNLKDVPFVNYDQALKNCLPGQIPIRRADDENKERVFRQYELYSENEDKIKDIMVNQGQFKCLDIFASDSIETVFDNILEYLQEL